MDTLIKTSRPQAGSLFIGYAPQTPRQRGAESAVRPVTTDKTSSRTVAALCLYALPNCLSLGGTGPNTNLDLDWVENQDLNWGVKDRKAAAPRQDPTVSATADDALREEIKTNCQRVSRGLSPRPLEWDKSELTGRRSVP